ncbi:hypothetical protein AYK24_03255 [Thermoplasmatales archaeon SG8-52-4]|nr:MAG: hypothetical protein AYK24_03255 [Thermoplasmatales archaeon SG8-52-4]
MPFTTQEPTLQKKLRQKAFYDHQIKSQKYKTLINRRIRFGSDMIFCQFENYISELRIKLFQYHFLQVKNENKSLTLY